MSPAKKRTASRSGGARARAAAPTVAEYLDRVPEASRDDARRLHKIIRAAAPDLEPFVVGGMLGYGRYHYRYASGREGDTFVVGVGPLKNGLSLHVVPGAYGKEIEAIAQSTPKAHVGKGCVRFKHLDDLDERQVVALVRAARAASTSQSR